MSISKRTISIETLENITWHSIFNREKERASVVFRKDHCLELTSTHRDLRPLPDDSSEGQGRTWDDGSMVPYYFDAPLLKQQLARLSEGVPETILIPFREVGGSGDSATARTAVQNEWIQVRLLPTDWMFSEKRHLEVWWLAGREEHIQNRYRRADTSPELAWQMPANYWGAGRLEWEKPVFTVVHPFPVQVVLCLVRMHVEDEHGFATGNAQVTQHHIVVGQLENGLVLWWHDVNSDACQIKQEGDYANIDGTLVHLFTGAGAQCPPHHYHDIFKK